MEISFSTMFFHDHPLHLIFDAVRNTGADTLEFWPETPDWWLDGLPIGRLVQEVSSHSFSFPLSVHAPVLDLNPCSINPDIVQVSLDWIEYSIRLAEDLGATVCTIHPGRRTSKRPPTDTDYRRLDHMLDVIEPLAEGSSVQISIENMEPQVNALLSTPDEIFHVLKKRDWLSFTLDACHTSSQGVSVLSEFIEGADDRIANVHLSGAAGKVLHLPAKGNAWADTALEALVDAGYNGLITLEINDLSVDQPLTYAEKIEILANDVEYVRSFDV
ncbi:MAG: sugar phosphate isomerase/epimerase family protein [Methanobacteriota archaeon]